MNTTGRMTGREVLIDEARAAGRETARLLCGQTTPV
jgi:hypothetical protein